MAKSSEKGFLALTKIFSCGLYNRLTFKKEKERRGKMNMERGKIRQMIMTIAGMGTCGISILGCYPLVPAYFTALYLEEIKSAWLVAIMYLGMLLFMPLTATVKYMITILTIVASVRFVKWANEGCPTYIAAGLSAILTMILSFAGGLLQWKGQSGLLLSLLEGMLIFGGTILLHRMVHEIFAWTWREPLEKVVVEHKREERLQGYAESFQGLSKNFDSMSIKRSEYSSEELGRMQNELTGKMCANCDSCALCWERDATPLYGILSRIIVSVMHSGAVETEDEADLHNYCKKSEDMMKEALRVFEKAKLNRAWYNRLLENRKTIAEQLDAMAYIMRDCAREEEILDNTERKKIAELRYRAKEHGIVIEELHLRKNIEGHLKLEAMLRSKSGGCISLKTFISIVAGVFGGKFRTVPDTKTFIMKEAVKFVLLEDTKFRSVQGISRLKKDGAQISGDNFSFFELEGGQLLMGVSDGMGSGVSASKESEMVLDLMEKFLEAGFSVETAIRMMNSAMVMKGDCDLYSTMDLCNIDMYSGETDFFKIGATGSFVKSGKNVTCYSAESLPVGVGNNLEIGRCATRLKSGDFVVMVTDGVLEYLHVPKPEETMKEIIQSIDTNHPGILVKKIMERVMLFTGGKVQDDMTILATCIWEK